MDPVKYSTLNLSQPSPHFPISNQKYSQINISSITLLSFLTRIQLHDCTLGSPLEMKAKVVEIKGVESCNRF